MAKEKLVAFLHASNLVGLEQAHEIAAHFDHLVISKNGYLLKAGQVCDNYFFMENGALRAFAYDTEGNDVTTNICIGMQVVFEVSSFFNRTKSKENIIALTDCEGWNINYEQLNKLFHAMPEFRNFGRHTLVKGFSILKTRMLDMITSTAEERYVALLETNPQVFQYVPLKNIASYLGITDTSLSRIRKELSQK